MLYRCLSVLPVFIALVGGCTGGEQILVSSDIRVDNVSEPDEVDSDSTGMCVDRNGVVYVVWLDDRDGTPSVWFNKSADGGISWESLDTKVNHGTGVAFSPAIACTDSGVFVVWEDDRDSDVENHNIYYNRSRDQGVTWLPADLILEDDADGDSMSIGPQIVATNNKIHVVWFDALRGGYDIMVATSHDGESFFPQVRLDGDEPGAAYSAWPQIEADGEGNVYVVWEDSRDGKSDIYFAGSYDDGLTFQPDIRLDLGDQPGQFDSFSPRFSAEGSRVYVVWSDDRNGDERDILMNWSPNRGLTWATGAIRVESDNLGFYDSRFPDVAVQEGTAYFVWEDARNGGYDVMFRAAVDGNFSTEEVRLDTDQPGEGNSLKPRVTLRNEFIVVAWEERRADTEGEGYNDIYYNWSADGGVIWDPSDRRIDNMDPGASFKVDINIDVRSGDLWAAWTDGRNGTSDVFFHRLTVGEDAEYNVVDVAPGTSSE